MTISFKSIKLILFLLIVIAQLSVPATMVIRHEYTSNKGIELKFAVIPVDPVNPYMGRYVTMQFEKTLANPTDESYRKGEKAWVTIRLDEHGFAHPVSLLKDMPADSIAVPVTINSDPATRRTIPYEYTFEQYFMNEDKAQKVESRLRNSGRQRDANDVYLSVYVNGGVVSVNGLFIDGKPAEEFAGVK